MSALASIVTSLGELSESELRQLYLMVGVRLGIPDVPPGVKPQGGGGGKASNAKSSAAKGRKKTTSSKGNPQRKSQWANHPLYQEYSRLKKVVEAQAKDAKCSFNAVDTSEARAYRQAFTLWVEAKHSFRGHGESGQIRDSREEGNRSDEESEEEEAGPSKAAPLSAHAKHGPPQSTPASAGKPSAGAKAGGSPPGKGKTTSK